MVDVIFNAPDLASLVVAAEAMGFYKTPEKGRSPEAGIINNGAVPGGGNWTYNYVGVIQTPTDKTETVETMPGIKEEVPIMETQPGIWGRIRHNGDPQWLPKLPDKSPITLYYYVDEIGWSADGKTPAPEWVGNIGTFL